MGHVHAARLADLPMPRRLHDELIASGRAQPHHILPETGWISVWIDGPRDVSGVIELFRMQYDRYSRTPAPSSVYLARGDTGGTAPAGSVKREEASAAGAGRLPRGRRAWIRRAPDARGRG